MRPPSPPAPLVQQCPKGLVSAPGSVTSGEALSSSYLNDHWSFLGPRFYCSTKALRRRHSLLFYPVKGSEFKGRVVTGTGSASRNLKPLTDGKPQSISMQWKIKHMFHKLEARFFGEKNRCVLWERSYASSRLFLRHVVFTEKCQSRQWSCRTPEYKGPLGFTCSRPKITWWLVIFEERPFC